MKNKIAELYTKALNDDLDPNVFADEVLKLIQPVQWIPVSERLPLIEQDVLVYDGFGKYITNILDESGTVWDESHQIFDEITHWMELPDDPI